MPPPIDGVLGPPVQRDEKGFLDVAEVGVATPPSLTLGLPISQGMGPDLIASSAGPWWNTAAEAQAVDQAHRIGQHRCHRLSSPGVGGTIEERVVELQTKKRALFCGRRRRWSCCPTME